MSAAISATGTSTSPVAKHRMVEILVVACLYFISARIGQTLAIPPGNVTPIWLPSGIMVALTFIRGPGIWPGVFLGAFAGNAWAYFSLDSVSIALSALFAGLCNGLGDVLSTVGAVLLLRVISKQPRVLGDYKDFGLFIALAVLAGPAVSALFGVTSLAAMGFLAWSDYLPTLITWWTGDGVGALLIAPLIIAWHERYRSEATHFISWKAALLISASICLAYVLFRLVQVPHWIYLTSYAIAPMLLIYSLFLGQAKCFSALMAFAAVAVIATSQGFGPFSKAEQNINLMELQLFIAIMTGVICFLSITVKLRLRAEEESRNNAMRLIQAQEQANIGSWDLDVMTNTLTWSPQVFFIFEVDPESFEASYDGFLNAVHPDDRDYVHQAYVDSLKHKKPYELEHRLLMPDGRIKYVHERCESSFNENGDPVRSVGTVQDITERKLAEQKILHQAHYDNLTDLPNRFLSLDRLAQLLREADRDNTKIGILFIDLDYFKNVNDSLGHHVGDDLLVDVARRLKNTVRAGDTVGRLGGDEFLVLLRDVHCPEEARVAVEHLLDLFRKPFNLEGREISISASIGVVMYPGGGEDANEVLRNADLAMYRSKELGRNNYAFFSAEMNEHVSRRLAIEEAMRGALERKEFSVHYQAQVDVSSGKWVAAEALLRWRNDALGDVSPDEFIPIAEQTGLIVDIGKYVLSEALAIIATLNKAGRSDIEIAVNLSPRQFKDPSFVSYIESEIERVNVSPELLELEITEGLLMSGYGNVDETLRKIHDVGIKIALDDFGTGYASLSYLRTYPFDSLKIDRSFINDIEDHDGRELVNAAIAMAHALDLKVVAEGVETNEQLDILKALDCDYAQGYLFSKPVNEEEFLALLR